MCFSRPIASIAPGSAVQGSRQLAATSSFPWNSFALVHNKFLRLVPPYKWFLQEYQVSFPASSRGKISSKFFQHNTNTTSLSFTGSWLFLHQRGLDLSPRLEVRASWEKTLYSVLSPSSWGSGRLNHFWLL